MKSKHQRNKAIMVEHSHFTQLVSLRFIRRSLISLILLIWWTLSHASTVSAPTISLTPLSNVGDVHGEQGRSVWRCHSHGACDVLSHWKLDVSWWNLRLKSSTWNGNLEGYSITRRHGMNFNRGKVQDALKCPPTLQIYLCSHVPSAYGCKSKHLIAESQTLAIRH